MEEFNNKVEIEELEFSVVDEGMDTYTEIGTRGVCCSASIFPIRSW